MTPNVAILAGEASGDAVGAALAEAVGARAPGVRIWGLGGRRMADAGVDLLYDCSGWSSIGVIQSLRVAGPLALQVFPAVKRALAERSPAVVVPIDFGFFNVRVARYARSIGLPVLYYFPPGSWRAQARGAESLAEVTSRIATPFPWSEKALRAAGCDARFVGHPVLEMARPTLTKAQFAERLGLEAGATIVGLLPGSRGFEVTHNTPAMLGACRRIRCALPDAQFVVGLAPSLPRQRLERLVREHGAASAARRLLASGRSSKVREPALITPEGVAVPAERCREWVERVERVANAPRMEDPLPVVIAEGLTHDVMAHSDVLLVCSGTATLEAAVLGTPMVILYRGSKLMELEYGVRRLKRLEHIGMPNILAGERIVPEFVQHEATPDALAEAALRYLRDPDCRAWTRQRLLALRDQLGGGGATERVADMVVEMAGIAGQGGGQ